MFTSAKKYLEEEEGFAVVAGYLSPSHDMYVARKLGSEDFIRSRDRCWLAFVLLFFDIVLSVKMASFSVFNICGL